MVSGWNWIIPGGTPSSSILQNPQVTYSSVGTKQSLYIQLMLLEQLQIQVPHILKQLLFMLFHL